MTYSNNQFFKRKSLKKITLSKTFSKSLKKINLMLENSAPLSGSTITKQVDSNLAPRWAPNVVFSLICSPESLLIVINLTNSHKKEYFRFAVFENKRKFVNEINTIEAADPLVYLIVFPVLKTL
jgi:hypothetical protein